MHSPPSNPPATDQTGVFNSTLERDIALPVNATVDQLDDIPLSEVQSFKEPALPWYSDQALPFEITVAAANEYGAAASCKLFGVEILNEGWGMSIDDSVNEMQAAAHLSSISQQIGQDYQVLPVDRSTLALARRPDPEALPHQAFRQWPPLPPLTARSASGDGRGSGWGVDDSPRAAPPALHRSPNSGLRDARRWRRSRGWTSAPLSQCSPQPKSGSCELASRGRERGLSCRGCGGWGGVEED